jgi:hypothetical protein
LRFEQVQHLEYQFVYGAIFGGEAEQPSVKSRLCCRFSGRWPTVLGCAKIGAATARGVSISDVGSGQCKPGERVGLGGMAREKFVE